MTLAERWALGPFTTRWYHDPVLDSAGHETPETTPVWSIAPESLIVSPTPHETIEISAEREIRGWAWADGGVRSVYVRTDDRATWRRAELEPPRGREWQRFSMRWMPGRRGAVVLASLAGDGDNAYQTAAADCLQRPLLRRSRFRQRLSASGHSRTTRVLAARE